MTLIANMLHDLRQAHMISIVIRECCHASQRDWNNNRSGPSCTCERRPKDCFPSFIRIGPILPDAHKMISPPCEFAIAETSLRNSLLSSSWMHELLQQHRGTVSGIVIRDVLLSDEGFALVMRVPRSWNSPQRR